MSKYLLTIASVILAAAPVISQETRTSGSASAQSATSAAADGKAINLESGTRLAGQLQNTLDVRRAKVGDQVVLKMTQAIKSQGRTVVHKGARLIGRVTEVSRKSGDSSESSIGLVFDRLESGSLSAPISATITSITQASTRARVSDEGLSSDAGARSTTSTRTSSGQSSGGLLGGVGGAVGGVLNTTTQTAGGVVGSTTGAVGSTVGTTTRTLGGIRISESTDASAEGGSTLSLTGDNLRLEKGTTFGLRLSQSATVSKEQ